MMVIAFDLSGLGHVWGVRSATKRHASCRVAQSCRLSGGACPSLLVVDELPHHALGGASCSLLFASPLHSEGCMSSGLWSSPSHIREPQVGAGSAASAALAPAAESPPIMERDRPARVWFICEFPSVLSHMRGDLVARAETR